MIVFIYDCIYPIWDSLLINFFLPILACATQKLPYKRDLQIFLGKMSSCIWIAWIIIGNERIQSIGILTFSYTRQRYFFIQIIEGHSTLSRLLDFESSFAANLKMRQYFFKCLYAYILDLINISVAPKPIYQSWILVSAQGFLNKWKCVRKLKQCCIGIFY